MDNTNIIRRVYVEKREEFAVEAGELLRDLRQNLGIHGISALRILNRYDISGVTDEEYTKAVSLVFSEPPLDEVHHENVDTEGSAFVFAVESLPGQFNQRADSAAQCVQILTCGNRPECLTARVIVLYGDLSQEDRAKITSYIINPVESRLAALEKPAAIVQPTNIPEDVRSVDGFTVFSDGQLLAFMADSGFAMTYDDMMTVREYFASEQRDPTVTELRVLDTYWSDHCRHTTFLSRIQSVAIEGSGGISDEIGNVYAQYLRNRRELYGDREAVKPVCLMDLATSAMKILRRDGYLEDLDVSDEINACSIRVPVTTDSGSEDYLVMFKNETHNHPTEIEPFGGAATCLGGAIRDPLSGRSYVYQAMRVTGSGNPTVPVTDTLPGKLSQRKITTGAAAGYSSYGNQIGLATGLVDEIYHPGYVAKRMEIGAVIAAVPAHQVVRETPAPGDIVILLGGRTGRDGCGGATGSSKEHNEDSINLCGAEVQKGNPPTERKIQRLFRNPKVSALIKRCNDFGAGGVCVAIGELADGLEIDLDSIPKKYDGLDGTELAISESQERMAVVISPSDEALFLHLAADENLEAVTVARVTGDPRMKMKWRGKTIVDISRSFIDTNGAPSNASARIGTPDMDHPYFTRLPDQFIRNDFTASITGVLDSLGCCSRKGLAERFDSSIGAGTVLMPFGGSTQRTPENGMAAKIPVSEGITGTSTVMTYGFDPFLSQWSPFHGAYYAVLESLAKTAAMGGDASAARLTFQEYFERLGKDDLRWGKPFAALLGAYKAQLDFRTAAIGGKDSMSGTFKELNVPPTLVSFAVSISEAEHIVSAAFRHPDKAVLCLPVIRDSNHMPVAEASIRQFAAMRRLSCDALLLSASTVKTGGIAAAVAKMSFGNRIGFAFDSALTLEALFVPAIGGIIAQIDRSPDNMDDAAVVAGLIDSGEAFLLGTTISEPVLRFGQQQSQIEDLVHAWENKLEKVFPTRTEPAGEVACAVSRPLKSSAVPTHRTARPRVLIPVFPGTNCEYDTARAFDRAGAVSNTLIFKNLTAGDVSESIETLRRSISETNILVIPGGFSGGDEPDGSGKFIATAFRNAYVAEEIEKLLNQRDGLILGICNGFQALIKLGLLPYGHICGTGRDSATLTYNSIGRHVSCYVRTGIVSNLSPWLRGTEPGDVHLVPVSHGEGRFVAPPALIHQLFEAGQVATQYVDYAGNPSMDIPFNPNGSMYAIEGITSPDGRILGKMGHSERTGIHIGMNVPGNKDQKIFESGAAYFK
ncbi:MAG: phosphoribosylformylglycinamidine synthase [Saccharofermentanales bacterium]